MDAFSFEPYLRPIVPLKEPTDVDVLQYAAGFCDTDASFQVEITKDNKLIPSVTVSQAIGGYKSIEYMYDQFGGSIVKHVKATKKTNQPSLTWHLCSISDITRFCAMLAPHMTVKAREAKLLMMYPLGNLHTIGVRATNLVTGEEREFPTLKECCEYLGSPRINVKDGPYEHDGWRCEAMLTTEDKKAIRARREEIQRELTLMKTTPHDPIPADVMRRHAYFAGAADGDVTFGVDPKTRESQKHAMNKNYRALPDFFARTYRGHVSKHKKKDANDNFRWELTRKIDAAAFVKAVAPYLRGKRPQAELIMRMPKGGAVLVNCLLRDLKGKLGRSAPWIDRVRGLLDAIRAAPSDKEVLTLMEDAAATTKDVVAPSDDVSSEACSSSGGAGEADLSTLVKSLGNLQGFKRPPKEEPPGVQQDRKSKLYFASMRIHGKQERMVPDFTTMAEAEAWYAEVKHMPDDNTRFLHTQKHALKQQKDAREARAAAVDTGDIKLPPRVYMTTSKTFQAKVRVKGPKNGKLTTYDKAVGTFKTIEEAVAAQMSYRPIPPAVRA